MFMATALTTADKYLRRLVGSLRVSYHYETSSNGFHSKYPSLRTDRSPGEGSAPVYWLAEHGHRLAGVAKHVVVALYGGGCRTSGAS